MAENIEQDIEEKIKKDIKENTGLNIKVNNIQGIKEQEKYIEKEIKTEIDEIKDFVTKGYREILLREPDIGGLNHYIEDIRTERITKEKFLEILEESEEYKMRFIEMAKKTNPSKRKGINFAIHNPVRKIKITPSPTYSELTTPSITNLVYCMMGGNRLHEIKDYIPMVLPYIDGLVYVDSHSTDSTLEFMKDLSEKNGGKIVVIEKDWEDRFSLFRNHYLDHLRNTGYKGWIITSDTDEHFPVETLSKLRELIQNAKSYTGVAFRAYDITLDDNDRTKIVSESLSNYWKRLMFRYHQDLHYEGEPHETLTGHKINWVQTELIYKHSRSKRKVYERATENFFISNSNRYSVKWGEFRQLCTKNDIMRFAKFFDLYKKGILSKEIEDWIYNHRNDEQDSGDSEVREMAQLYYEILHPDKLKGR